MSDPIASFPFQNPTTSELSIALGNAFAEFVALQSQADIISKFVTDARAGGVRQFLAEQASEGIQIGESLGLFGRTSPGQFNTPENISTVVEHQISTADYGAKLAAIVLLHSAVERFFWRLVRFGVVANRQKALERIGEKRVTVSELQTAGPDAVVDSDGDTLTFTVISGPSDAAIFVFNSNGTFEYRPIADWDGTDEFTYEINDGFDTAQATVTFGTSEDVVEVTAPNPAATPGTPVGAPTGTYFELGMDDVVSVYHDADLGYGAGTAVAKSFENAADFGTRIGVHTWADLVSSLET